MILANSSCYVAFCSRLVRISKNFLCFPKLNEIAQMKKIRIFAYAGGLLLEMRHNNDAGIFT